MELRTKFFQNKNPKVELKEKIVEKATEININQEESYSFSYEPENPIIQGIQGINQLSIDLDIKNDGKLDWPKGNIFLMPNKEKSQIMPDEIKIISLRSGWVSKERIVFKYLNNLPPGIYHSYIDLNICGKNYGKQITIKVEILKREYKEENLINTYIKRMRKEFNIPENEIEDNDLKNVIIKNNYDIQKAFEDLFNAN